MRAVGDGTYMVNTGGGEVAMTREPCPKCGVRLLITVGFLEEVGSEFRPPGKSFDGWDDRLEEYETPVYVFCDSPVCPYHGLVERPEIAAVLQEWMTSDAPTWQELYDETYE